MDAERVLFRQDGPNARTIVLETSADGGCRLAAYDSGNVAEATFGRPEYEFWVSLAAPDMIALCRALLEDRLSGRSSAVDDLAGFCTQFEIPFERGSW